MSRRLTCEPCSKRHLAQEEKANDEKSADEVKKTKSYASLKNWGHDPLKKRQGNSKSTGGSKDDGGEEDKGDDKQAGDKRKAPADKEEEDKNDSGPNKKRETEKGESTNGDDKAKGNKENDKDGDEDESRADGESVGHDSGRQIVEILKANPDKEPDKYTDDQIQHMRKVVSYW